MEIVWLSRGWLALWLWCLPGLQLYNGQIRRRSRGLKRITTMGSRYVQIIGVGNEVRRIGPPVGIRPRQGRPLHSATGKSKSKGIVPNPGDKVMAKRSRSYKTEGYALWCKKYNGRKVRGSST